MVRLARRAEAAGFESAWVAETRMTRDAFVPMAAIAQATERMHVGSAIVNVFNRSPMVIAVTLTSLRELAPHRVIGGLGAGSPLILGKQGIAFHRPVTRLREYVQVLRPLLAGDPVTFSGETIELDDVRIEDIAAGTSPGLGGGDVVPLYLGVTGPRALELGGEVADGVLINGFMSTAYVDRALDRIGRGAARAGRALDDVDVCSLLVTSCDERSSVAKDRARRLIAMYLSMFANIARESGLDESRVAHTRERFQAGGIDAAAATIDDDIVDTLTVAGTPDECAARMDAYRARGVNHLVLSPIGDTHELVIDALGATC
ncbi:LLM class flavin-dependent oxidoreductase [Capillimicrobium parvum]|uniref:Coenzyme F420-dependent oxidoreductase n=1 Tax=Capillimicrobium parvum TaxID=2884022 RepID=A0A9E7BZF8_9ACTN|nr:LLM class flavin-dependent oxidoreductase [Capillimicrobium parvum]UGS34529.1 Putative coenzyme F420-dependent oxidoreductase [Capillimicrobium parvum]